MLELIFKELADVFDGDRAIEVHARQALLESAPDAAQIDLPVRTSSDLQDSILKVMTAEDAHPVCRLITAAPFEWTPPQTSNDPLYLKHGFAKAHVELLGPSGLLFSDSIRIGLFGMLPGAEYGIRTHPAEEIYVMLAGLAEWKRGNDSYLPHVCGEKSYHPSMIEHANRTRECGFMSAYVWHGDISTDGYRYTGQTDGA